MKIRTLIIATTLLTAATSFAFAQSSPAPANQSGPGVSPSASPTDQGADNETGNTKGVPTRGTMNAQPAPATTTGAAPANESMQKDKSPASQGSGIKQEK
jgi:hypothetical protein